MLVIAEEVVGRMNDLRQQLRDEYAPDGEYSKWDDKWRYLYDALAVAQSLVYRSVDIDELR